MAEPSPQLGDSREVSSTMLDQDAWEAASSSANRRVADLVSWLRQAVEQVGEESLESALKGWRVWSGVIDTALLTPSKDILRTRGEVQRAYLDEAERKFGKGSRVEAARTKLVWKKRMKTTPSAADAVLARPDNVKASLGGAAPLQRTTVVGSNFNAALARSAPVPTQPVLRASQAWPAAPAASSAAGQYESDKDTLPDEYTRENVDKGSGPFRARGSSERRPPSVAGRQEAGSPDHSVRVGDAGSAGLDEEEFQQWGVEHEDVIKIAKKKGFKITKKKKFKITKKKKFKITKKKFEKQNIIY